MIAVEGQRIAREAREEQPDNPAAKKSLAFRREAGTLAKEDSILTT